VAVAGATTVATIAVASGVAAAAPDGPASKTAPSRPAAGMAVLDSTSATRQVAREKADLAALEQDRLVAEAQAAARREARRRAAAGWY